MLDQTDQRLIDALLSQPNKRAAAKAAGVSDDTLYRRMKNPDLLKALDAEVHARRERMADLLESAAREAVGVLRDIACDSGGPWGGVRAADRVRAAEVLLSMNSGIERRRCGGRGDT